MEPEYVLRFTDSNPLTPKKSKKWVVIQRICLIIIVYAILMSIILHKNLWADMTGYSIGVLFGTLIFAWFKKEVEWTPFSVEILFYKDHIIIIREKAPYNGGKWRHEWYKMDYKDIKEVRYLTKFQRIEIYGVVHGIKKWYLPNGEFSEKGIYDKITDSGVIINTKKMEDIDIKSEFENHSPLSVIVDEQLS